MKKKILAIALTLCMCFGATACGNPEDLLDSTKTFVYLEIADSGLGRNWAYDVQKRFNEEFKDYQIPGVEGKTGIELLIADAGSSLNVRDKRQSTSMILEKMVPDDADMIKGSGFGYDMTDIVTSPNPFDNNKTIAEKIKDEAKPWYVTEDGKYYQIPHVEYEPCLTYDKNCFDRNGLYLANVEDGTENAIEYHSALTGTTIYVLDTTYSNFNFQGDEKFDETNADHSRSIGPDAQWGTYDDGMPMNVLELAALCDYMKNEKSITPFVLTGKYENYANWLPTALMNAMLGPDGVQAVYDLDSSKMTAIDGIDEHNGKMEVVTGYTDEKLFPGASDNTIRKPITAWVELTEQNGYYHTWSAAKYYAQVFTQLADQQEWFTTKRSSHTHQDAMWEFIFNGFGARTNIQSAFLVECTFWYQEAASQGFHQDFEDEFAAKYDQVGVWVRDMRVMGLPRSFDLGLEDGIISKPMAGTGAQQGSFFLNSNIEGNYEKEEAVKIFIQWWYSDKELENFTKMSNLFRQMNYLLSQETLNSMPSYTASVYNVFKSDKNVGETIYYASKVPSVRENALLFQRSYSNGAFTYGGTGGGSFLKAYRDNANVTATVAFQSQYQMVNAEQWKQRYKGTTPLTDENLYYQGIKYSPLK